MSINRGGSKLLYYTRSRNLAPLGFENGHAWQLAPGGVKDANGKMLRPVIYHLVLSGNSLKGWVYIQDQLVKQSSAADTHIYITAFANAAGLNFVYDDPIVGKAGQGLELTIFGMDNQDPMIGVGVSYSVGYIAAESGVDS